MPKAATEKPTTSPTTSKEAKPAKGKATAIIPDKLRPETQEEYRQRIIDMIYDVTISSAQGLDRICKAFAKDNPNFPHESTVRGWLRENEELATQYARAKEEQVEKLVEQIIDISDDDSLDMAFKEDGTPYVNTEHIQRSKLRVDSRKWIASKLKPKKYGDKLELAGDKDNPLTINVVKFSG